MELKHRTCTPAGLHIYYSCNPPSGQGLTVPRSDAWLLASLTTGSIGPVVLPEIAGQDSIYNLTQHVQDVFLIVLNKYIYKSQPVDSTLTPIEK